MSWPETSIPVPNMQLVGFERIPLSVGKETKVEFTIEPHNLQVWLDDTTGWGTLKGNDEITFTKNLLLQ